MLALSMWLGSGSPWSVLAPSSVWVSTASWAWPWPLWFLAWKLPAASVKPIGACMRWSCQVLTKKKTWVVFCLRFTCHENGLSGSHVHGYGLSQNRTFLRWNGVSG